MDRKKFFKIRLYLTGIVSITIGALLVWQHYHGGVPIHHIAADETLPAISNWWGVLLLPVLTWFLTYRIQKRVFGNKDAYLATTKSLLHVLYRFTGALLFGILIAVCFSFGYHDMTGNLVLGLLPVAIFFPIYRAECLLGFVIAMTFTFGAVLPTGFGTFLTLVAAGLYLYIRAGIVYAWSKFAPLLSFSKHKPQP
ncbi:hypothetical protein [Pontibacter sp. HJ8]